MSTILITGATGGLGSAVANHLKKLNPEQNIAVLVRDTATEAAKKLADNGFEIRVADYDQTDLLEKAFTGVDILYFVSGSDMANRRTQHKNVVETAKSTGVRHVFYTGVSMNNPSKDSAIYQAMEIHLETEQWIKEAGLTYTFLRHNLYGEVIPMFIGGKEQVLGGKTIILPTGDGKTAFVPRAELAEAGANALANARDHENKVYEMNGNQNVTFAEVAEYLSDILGEKIAYVSPEVDEFKSTMQSYEVPEMYIDMMVTFGVGIANGVFDAQQSDLETLLGRKSMPIVDFLKQVY